MQKIANSNLIGWLGYNAESQTAWVFFKPLTRLVAYAGVPPATFKDWINAERAGDFFAEQILPFCTPAPHVPWSSGV